MLSATDDTHDPPNIRDTADSRRIATPIAIIPLGTIAIAVVVNPVAVTSSYTDTVNSYPIRAAALGDLHDKAVRLMKWREWHGLRRCREGQGKRKSGAAWMSGGSSEFSSPCSRR